MFVHRLDIAGVVSGHFGEQSENSGGRNREPSCLDSEYQPHPAVPGHVNARRRLYWPVLVEAACASKVPIDLLDAVVLAESLYQAMALSRAGAAGLAQLMPETARELGVGNRYDPRENLHGGARYLRQMLDRFGSPLAAVAAYNAGPGAVQRAGGVPPLQETLAYVRRVMRYWADGTQKRVVLASNQPQSRQAENSVTMTRVDGVAGQ